MYGGGNEVPNNNNNNSKATAIPKDSRGIPIPRGYRCRNCGKVEEHFSRDCLERRGAPAPAANEQIFSPQVENAIGRLMSSRGPVLFEAKENTINEANFNMLIGDANLLRDALTERYNTVPELPKKPQDASQEELEAWWLLWNQTLRTILEELRH